jgi:hypothetical protein
MRCDPNLLIGHDGEMAKASRAGNVCTQLVSLDKWCKYNKPYIYTFSVQTEAVTLW